MPEKEKFDLKDILLIVLSCLLIVAVIALSVSFSSYAILSQRFNDTHANSSEACISSESFEREIADNYAMPDSNIVSYEFSRYFYYYIEIDHTYLNGDSFLDETFNLETLLSDDVDDLPDYFQPTAIVYNLNVSLWGTDDAQQQLAGTSIIVGGAESNSIYSFSLYTYELSYSWQSAEPYTRLSRNSIFSAGDSVSISARIDDQSDFYQGMEFEIEYEIEVTRVYGYNLTEYIGEKENDAFRDGEQLGYETGYDDGFDDGSEQGYNQGYSDGYDAGVDSFDSLVQGAYDEGYDFGYDVGYDAGVDYGYTSGYTDGFHDGEYEGASSAGDYSFFALVSAIFDAPLKVLIGEWQQDSNGDWQLVGGMLNFVIPGLDVNFAPLLTSLFTISLLLFLLRFILGVVL